MTIKAQIEERDINMQNNLASMIKEKKLFLLDIDGTVALGSKLLPGAGRFHALHAQAPDAGAVGYLWDFPLSD